MELTGTIVKIKEIENILAKKEGGKDFQKREFWLQITVGGTPLGGIPHEKFPQTLALELHGDKVSLIDAFAEGQEITVNINLKGKIIGDKCYNTLQVWRIQDMKSR